MKILYTADIHADPGHLQAALSVAFTSGVDAIVIGGDIIPHHLPRWASLGPLGAQREYLVRVMIPALSVFREKRPVPVYLDLGNDDWLSGRDLMTRHDGTLFHLIHMRRHRLDPSAGIDLIGYMCVPPTPFGRKDWEKPDTRNRPHPPENRVRLDGYRSGGGRLEAHTLDLAAGDTIALDMDRLSAEVRGPFILVSHSPPYGTPLDVIQSGLQVGSLSIRRFIERWAAKGQLLASLHGHIHESPRRSGRVHTHIGGALCINPGQENGPGARLRYVLLEIAAGPSGGPVVRILREPGEEAPRSSP
ncbi:metallophosphoesterase [Desulfococcus sp.]|uniref:metallophosphoesterase family protein n=1 Tax=Desulfococcus sp. TaxID=2025834 RepID=UPI0035945AD7